jgi:trehalose/maltose transport system permease protein
MSQHAVPAPLIPATLTVPGKRGASLEKSRERLAWLMVAPSLLAVAAVALYPLIETFRLSFTNARFGSRRAVEYVGWANYSRILNDDVFWTAVRHTIQFTVVSVVLETVLGLAVALVINSNFPGRGVLRTAILLPWAIMTVVSARLWGWMLEGTYGVINDVLYTRLGILDEKIPWIARSTTSLWAMVAIDVWKTTPFMALLLLAGLQIIPGDLYEASTVDGASKWQQFWQMTLPLLRPALIVALIFRTMDAFRVFDLPYVLNAGATSTITVAVYAQQLLVNDQRLGRSSAASVLIFLAIGVMVIVYTRLVKVEEG